MDSEKQPSGSATVSRRDRAYLRCPVTHAGHWLAPLRGNTPCPRRKNAGYQDFEKYRLFYLDNEDCVDVIRVLHGARDIPEALQS